MHIKFNKEVILTKNEVEDILINYLHKTHNLSGIFDVNFIVVNKPKPSKTYIQDTLDNWVFDGAKVNISENE